MQELENNAFQIFVQLHWLPFFLCLYLTYYMASAASQKWRFNQKKYPLHALSMAKIIHVPEHTIQMPSLSMDAVSNSRTGAIRNIFLPQNSFVCLTCQTPQTSPANVRMSGRELHLIPIKCLAKPELQVSIEMSWFNNGLERTRGKTFCTIVYRKHYFRRLQKNRIYF